MQVVINNAIEDAPAERTHPQATAPIDEVGRKRGIDSIAYAVCWFDVIDMARRSDVPTQRFMRFAEEPYIPFTGYEKINDELMKILGFILAPHA